MTDEEKKAVSEAIEAMKRASRILEENIGGEVNRPRVETSGTTMWFRCGCGQPVQYGDRYCRMCGRAVKW